jgi:hypothetical protein
MVIATVGISRPSQHDKPTDLKPGCSKIRQNLPAVAYGAKPLGISRCDGCYMPMVAPTIMRIATVGESEAESEQNLLDLENQFSHRWMCYSMDCRFKMAYFSQKKGSATINLGLNYCSMGSSQSPSCDAVPLNGNSQEARGWGMEYIVLQVRFGLPLRVTIWPAYLK